MNGYTLVFRNTSMLHGACRQPPYRKKDMKQWIYVVLAASLCLLLGANTSHAQQAVFTDASGKVQTGIFYGFSSRANHPTLTIPVSGDWVVIGGGGYTDWQSHGPEGSLLTASYPDPYF